MSSVIWKTAMGAWHFVICMRMAMARGRRQWNTILPHRLPPRLFAIGGFNSGSQPRRTVVRSPGGRPGGALCGLAGRGGGDSRPHAGIQRNIYAPSHLPPSVYNPQIEMFRGSKTKRSVSFDSAKRNVPLWGFRAHSGTPEKNTERILLLWCFLDFSFGRPAKIC